MSLTEVTWKRTVRGWRTNPEKLLAFIQGLLWEAEISPNSGITWRTEKGKIILYDGLIALEEEKKKLEVQK